MLEQIVYLSEDLKSLSSTILYTGEIFLPDGSRVNGNAVGFMGNVGSGFRANEDLTVRDFPASGFQLHIHEGETTEASSVVDYSRVKKVLLSSYDAAMADAGKPAYDAMERLQRLTNPNIAKMVKDYFNKDK